MNLLIHPSLARAAWLLVALVTIAAPATRGQTLRAAYGEARIDIVADGPLRSYRLSTTADLRDNVPADEKRDFAERPDQARVRSGDALFDGLYALAIHEALLNSVDEIQDSGYDDGRPIRLKAFQTGAKWPYVWTRDLAYSVDLALAQFDQRRSADSLLFKTSDAKHDATLAAAPQIVQDTGSGGSYPISTDRVTWTFGAARLLEYLPSRAQRSYAERFYPILANTIEQDRRLVFDERDGLYRGEQSFLDWREQTYPYWTHDDVRAIGMSKALSTNVGHYRLLSVAADLAQRLGRADAARRYADWAAELKTAINARLYDADAQLYAGYLLADYWPQVRVARYDLLGQSLAILTGVADEARSAAIIAHYPTGPHGPPVVWPQDPCVPIYHNHAIWPFVTAYWTKAARVADNPAAVAAGVRSLMQAAALNLSNMENLDFATGQAWARVGEIEGPVINSQRQLWSVAGYLAMVQDVIFGLETSWEGVRFKPYVPVALRNGVFAKTQTLELHNLNYRDRRLSVRVHLPPTGSANSGVCQVESIALNGERVSDGFVDVAALRPNNLFEIRLAAPTDAEAAPLRVISDFDDLQQRFGPPMPTWDSTGQDGVTVSDGLLTLHFACSEPNATFTIYRDGRRYADGVRSSPWTDPNSADYAEAIYCYAVAAEYERSGHASHLTPTRCYVPPHCRVMIPAKALRNEGGKLSGDEHHWMNWGAPDHELTADYCRAPRDGAYLIRLHYANGSGPVNTGVTCGVKRVQVLEKSGGAIVADAYVYMPQSGDWGRFEGSTPVLAALDADKAYAIRVFEDGYAHNMSYLDHNRRYTANTGGGDGPYNFVDIAGIELIRLDANAEQSD